MSYKILPNMRDRKYYEWDLEACVGDEVMDHDFVEAGTQTALNKHLDGQSVESLSLNGEPEGHVELVLVQRIGNDEDGERDRGHAYANLSVPVRPVLPDRFDNGERVPKKFKQQLARWVYRQRYG